MGKILAIDDKMDNLVTLSALLRHLMPGCTMITALSGKEGIEKAESESPDVILLDVKMPDMDGYETCRRLKSGEMTKRIPVIMITAIRTDPQSRIKGLEIGADAFLAKPIDEQELVSQLKVALRVKKAEDSLREEKESLEIIVQERTAALRESERKYRELFDDAVVGIYRSRIDGSAVLEVNQALCDIFECTRGEMLSEPAIIRWAHPKARQEMITQLNKGGMVKDYETDFVTKGGAIRNCLISVKLYPHKGYLEGTTIDITDRKRAEKKLRESEEKYRTVADYTYDWEYWLGPDGKFVYVSPSCERISGYRVEDFMQDPKLLEKISHKNDKQILTCHFSDCLQGNTKACELQFRIITRDGKEVWINHVCQDVYSLTGEYLGRRGSNRNITEHKQAEEEKRRLEERLQRAEKMEALGTLAGGVAHDLNNVLGIVVGYAEMILDDVDRASPLRNGLESIMSGGQKAAAIVDDLLTLARRGVPGRQVLNLNKIIAACQQSPEWAHLSSHHPSVTIKTDLEPHLLNISGSPLHLGKTLYNLIANASEAMARGGIVTVRTTNQYLDRPIQGYDQIREGDYVILSISDTGQGIHAVDLKRIFEPFYTKKVMGRSGTGLGLAVVWGTVKDHHGYINVQSEAGKGSTFTLYFPVSREDFAEDGIDVPISEYMGKGETILVVDDIKEQRDLATGMLRKLNYNVVSVASGEEAVAYLKEGEVDIMVLDMIMDPGMDGLDTYRSVLMIHPQQKAVIVSGFSESDRVHAAQGLGAGAYVRKPYVKEKLGLAVRKELDRTVLMTR